MRESRLLPPTPTTLQSHVFGAAVAVDRVTHLPLIRFAIVAVVLLVINLHMIAGVIERSAQQEARRSRQWLPRWSTRPTVVDAPAPIDADETTAATPAAAP